MDDNGLYCSASTTLKSAGPVSASVRLPMPINMTECKYEIGLTYISFVPTWLNVPDLWFIHTNHVDLQDFMRLNRVPHGSKPEVLRALSNQVLEEYGNNMTEARVKIFKDDKWKLRLQPNSLLELSPGLSFIFGLPEVIQNETARNKDFPIDYQHYERFVENSIYYVSCDQCVQNFVTSKGERSSILNFVHIPNANKGTVIQHSPVVNFVQLDGSLLHNISFTVGVVADYYLNLFIILFTLQFPFPRCQAGSRSVACVLIQCASLSGCRVLRQLCIFLCVSEF